MTVTIRSTLKTGKSVGASSQKAIDRSRRKQKKPEQVVSVGRRKKSPSELAISSPSSSSATAQHQRGPLYDFTMQALEMSLYGYLRQSDHLFNGHAISGLRFPFIGAAAQQQKLSSPKVNPTTDDIKSGTVNEIINTFLGYNC